MRSATLSSRSVFLSTPSARRATEFSPVVVLGSPFLSTPSARRATEALLRPFSAFLYFYPRPPRGGRRHASLTGNGHEPISIHALREEGDYFFYFVKRFLENFYPRPPRGGRLLRRASIDPTIAISIHALREEGDGPSQSFRPVCRYFYPRPPRGGRHVSSVTGKHRVLFLSTPSARRATASAATGEESVEISIHALREEGDSRHSLYRLFGSYFYPRPPRGGRPLTVRKETVMTSISIHALREEGDTKALLHRLRGGDFYPRPPRGGRRHYARNDGRTENFYPRPPRGGRRGQRKAQGVTKVFLSTPSARRATAREVRNGRRQRISIHALREEGDTSSAYCAAFP